MIKRIDTLKSDILTKKLEIERIEKTQKDMKTINDTFKIQTKIDIVHKRNINSAINSLKVIKSKQNIELKKLRNELKEEKFKRANYEDEKTSRVLKLYGM